MPDSSLEEDPSKNEPSKDRDAADLARRCAEEMWAGDRASALLGMRIESVGPGAATVTMTVRSDLVNGWGMCHGGLVASLADSAFAVACNSHGSVTVASGFEISLLAPAREGDVLVATATERARRSRVGVYDVTVIRHADGEVIAEFRGRSHDTGRSNPVLDEEDSGSPST